MPISTRVVLYTFLVKLLLAGLLFNGFITNFLSVSSINSGAVVIDLLVLAVILHLSARLLLGYYTGLLVSKVYLDIVIIWLALLIFTFLKLLLLDETPLAERLLGVRNNLLYMIPLIYIPLLFRKEAEVKRVVKFFLNLSYILVVFSIIQFFLSFNLPHSLLVVRGETIFSFYGTTIVRPTALLGNTIIFASFTIIVFAIYLAKYLYDRKNSHLIILLLIGLANILTLTRATFIGLVLVLGVSFFMRHARLSYSFIIKIFSSAIFVVIIALSGLYFYQDTFIVKRITGKEATTKGSTAEHMQQIEASVDFLKEHYITGAGVGSQGSSGDPSKKIITDGYWFQLMLENGLVLGLLYLIFYISCTFFAFRTFYKTDNSLLQQLCIAFVAFSLYFYAASFLNSGLAGRSNFITFWIIFGLLLAQYLIVKREQHALTRH